MEIRVLRYFLAIAREENMTRAAKYLHVTQPTLSKQIKQLEEEIGKKLFIRSNYSIKLTDEGLLLRKRAEDILSMVDKTMEEFQALDDITGGDIYIGAAESESFSYFATVAKDLQLQYPNVKFHLYSGNTEVIAERLDRGLLDFAIIVQEVDLSKYNYIKIPTSDTWGVIMRKDSPLAKKEYITIEDLIDLPLIVSRQGITEDYPKLFKEKLDQLHIVATFDLIYNASIMVKEGFGYALSFDKIVDTSENSELCFRVLKPELKTNMYIIWKKYQVFTPIAEKLLSKMQQHFNDR
ncbi:LysR family transcriptional regulator [Erysipelatoclostridium sp. An15]|uniref:LysR family transcriptional regulator n=1 Tax=Erysipelatoclostridium sp. An15 TaxID=1965566 RepID=UPI000B373087|nr:LysR family transcriptional regulator [Erysipelatoclostridium sp. An15]OUQ08483.1 LysR family transcriptional regulator [Erysipelatoclostridium sp. An15]